MKKIIEELKKNYILVICLGIVILLFIIMVVVWIKKGTFSLDDEVQNGLVLTCPQTAGVGEEISCEVSLNITDRKFYSVMAHYSVPEEITYVSYESAINCDDETIDCTFEATENGFGLADSTGYETDLVIGTVKFMLPDDALPNTTYDIKLVDATVTNEEEENESIPDAMSSVRIKNNIATMEDISIKYDDTSVSLSPNFDKDVLEYSANVDKEVANVQIGYVLTDINATTNGVGQKVSQITDEGMETVLHYGTNELEVLVTSEDGKVTKTYKFDVKRAYEFNTEVYVFNKTKNYIYTGVDKDDTIINSLETLSDGLSYNINDNNLEVKYNNKEILASIKIVTLPFNYAIADNKLILNGSVTYQDILNTLTDSEFTVKLFDKDGVEVTDEDTTLADDNSLEVYYDNDKVATYGFVTERFQINDLLVDGVNLVIKRLPDGMKYSELLDYIDTNLTITIVSHDTKEITEDSEIRTGDKIRVVLNGENTEFTISVLGDLDGDGIIKVRDVGLLYRYMKTDASERDTNNVGFMGAIDIDGNGTLSVRDVGLLYRYMKGILDSLEVVR